MDPTKVPLPVMLGGLVLLVVVGIMLSKGKSGGMMTTNGTDTQQNFKNSMELQNADLSKKSLLTSALLQYDKQRSDYSLGNSTLQAKTEIERQQLNNALTLGSRALDVQQNLGTQALDVQRYLGGRTLDVQKEQIASGERQNAANNETSRQNGVLNFFGNLIGGVISIFTGGLGGKK